MKVTTFTSKTHRAKFPNHYSLMKSQGVIDIYCHMPKLELKAAYDLLPGQHYLAITIMLLHYLNDHDGGIHSKRLGLIASDTVRGRCRRRGRPQQKTLDSGGWSVQCVMVVVLFYVMRYQILEYSLRSHLSNVLSLVSAVP
jgi:hypothetical protein